MNRMNIYRERYYYGEGSMMQVRPVYRLLKWAMDKIASLCLIIILAPLMLALAIAIRLSSKGPAIFKQIRIGQYGKPFTIYKFRTMRLDAPPYTPTCELGNHTDYITPIGAMLRKYSLDELPQLFNIFMGNMSLVGPRPVVPTENELVQMRTKCGVYTVLPGLTGYAQIMGRDQVGIQEKVRYDCHYIENCSLLFDMKILVQTLIKSIRAEGVHEGRAEVPGESNSPL